MCLSKLDLSFSFTSIHRIETTKKKANIFWDKREVRATILERRQTAGHFLANYIYAV